MLRFDNALITRGEFSLRANFDLQAGQRYAAIGPSGAGKSTLLGALAGFIPLAKGRVAWGDKDISNDPPAQRPMTMLFQDNNLFPHLTVTQNVGLGIRPDLRLDRQQQEKVADALARVGLAGKGDARPGNLSGGQQSRAALARVLVQDRPLLLLDEPFAALGPALRDEMLDLVTVLLDETDAALVMVTHSPDDAMRIAEKVIFVADGVANAPAPAAEILQNPPPALRDYLGEGRSF